MVLWFPKGEEKKIPLGSRSTHLKIPQTLKMIPMNFGYAYLMAIIVSSPIPVMIFSF